MVMRVRLVKTVHGKKAGSYQLILHAPFDSSENDFITLFGEAASNSFPERITLNEFLRCPRRWRQPTTVFLNWFDEVAASKEWKSWIKAVLRISVVVLLKFLRAKIVVTVHNSRPHELTTSGTAFHFLRKKLLLHADAVVGLCGETLAVVSEQYGESFTKRVLRKFFVVHHPKYPELSERSADDLHPEKFTFLFVGNLRPYKNIELVLKLAGEFEKLGYEADFCITGKPHSNDYLETVRRQAERLDNVTVVPRFIPRQEFESVIRSGSIILLPLDKNSSLNSGSCIHALSAGRNVVCPDIGTVKEFPPNLVFTYHPEESADGQEAFLNMAKEAFRLWELDREEFLRRENEVCAYIEEEYSIQRVSLQLDALFDFLWQPRRVLKKS